MLVLSLLATGASASDWPTFQKNNYNNGITSEVVPTSPGSADWTFTGPSGGWLGWESAPVIADGVVYNVYYNGDVYAVSLTNGNQLWCNDFIGGSGNFELSVPAYDGDNGRLYVGLSNGNSTTVTGIHALDVTDDGATLWSNTDSADFPANHQLNTPIKYEDGAIYFGSVHMADLYDSDDGYFYCVDASNGDVNWKFDNDCGFYFASPALIGDYVVVGDDNGTVRSFNKATGGDIETYETSAGQIRSAIVYDAGYIYFTTTNGSLFKIAFDTGTGEMTNAVSESSGVRTTTSPAVTSSYVYVGNDAGVVLCYDKSDLDLIDSEDIGSQIKSSPVVSTMSGSDYVYVTLNSGYAQACEFTSGEYQDRTAFGTDDYTLQGFAIADGCLVFGNDGKKLSCFN
jgi:outer membrane protein assembly factor BamB